MSLSPSALRKSIHQNKKIIDSMLGSVDRLAKEIIDYAVQVLPVDEKNYVFGSKGNMSIIKLTKSGYFLEGILKAQPLENGQPLGEAFFYFTANNGTQLYLFEDLEPEFQLKMMELVHDLLFPEDKI